jgi:hypothetical protein
MYFHACFNPSVYAPVKQRGQLKNVLAVYCEIQLGSSHQQQQKNTEIGNILNI